jgi:uncharacterized protein involved in exopolysaccharide biosynthesis
MVLDKLLRAALRHWRLLLIAPMLVPLLVVPLMLRARPTYYEAVARLWVDRPAYLRYTDDVSRYTPITQIQANRLSELLTTQSFATDVMNRTSMAGITETPRGTGIARDMLTRGFVSTVVGDHVLALRFRADTPQLAYEMVSAILDVFRDRLVTDRVTQADTATSFYGDRLKKSEEQVAKSTEAVRRYVATHPRAASVDPLRRTSTDVDLPAVALDPQLGELLRRLDLDKSDVERARLALDQAGMEGSAALAGQELGIQVIDAPQVPVSRTIEMRSLVLLPIVGLVVGLLLDAVLIILMAMMDRSIYSAAGLAPTAQVLTVVPRLAEGSRRTIAQAAFGVAPIATTPGGA